MTIRKFPLLMLAAAISSFVAASEPPSTDQADVGPPIPGGAFYSDKSRGWFWYEDPPEPQPEKKAKAPVPVQEPQEKKSPEHKPADELPPTGSVAWIRVMLPKLRDAAMDNPTRENLEAYYYAQRVMLDKAEVFSRKSVEAIRNDPFLDEDMRYPASNAASDAIATAAGKQKDQLLKTISKSAALMFFYKGENCVLCGQALSAITGLEYKYGFTIIPVSMDGKQLPGGKFQNTQYDTGLSKHLGIVTAPALAIAIPPNDVRVISFSTISMETAVSRILIAAKDSGIISEEEFNGTSRLNTMGLIDAGRLTKTPPDDAIKNTSDFVNRMREEARRAFIKDNGGEQ